MPPRASTAPATMACTEARSPVSPGTATTRRPVAAAISAAVAVSGSGVRAATTTSQPSSASTRATALPMPLLAPVTSARLPLSCRSIR